MDDSVLGTISIDSWQQFLANNEEIQSKLEMCCSNVADLIANCTSVEATITSINSALAGLKTVKAREIPPATELVSSVNTLSEFLKDKSLKIVAGISYAELAVEAFNNGTTVDEDAKNLFTKIITGAADLNIYWMLNEVLASKGFKGMGFILAYGTDQQFEGGDFVVGDGFNKLFDTTMDKISTQDWINNPTVWVNAVVGAAVVAFYTGVRDRLTDKGDWTNEDIIRQKLDMASSALSYAEWTVIYAAMGCGLPGAVVAGLVAIPTAWVLDKVVNRITGDDIIDEFELDGVKYKVPRNGNGKNGTFDVYLDNYDDSLKEYRIGNQLYSESEYKRILYESKDYEKLFEKDQGRILEEEYAYSSGEVDEYRKILEETAKISDPDEAYLYYVERMDNAELPCVKDLEYELIVQYGFDIEEFIDYNTRGVFNND